MLVSVVTACYNASRTLEAAIGSVVSQTHPEIEHIVIDGGSRDGTVDIIKRHGDSIAHWVSEPDKGLADAWNKGLKLARGEVIGLLNADDLYSPDAVADAARTIGAGDWALTYGDAAMFTEDFRNPDSLFEGRFMKDYLYGGMGFMHTTCFVSSRVYRELGGFDTRYRIAVDTDFLLRCFRKGVEFRKTCGVATYMRNGGMSQTQFSAAYMEYLLQLYRHGFPKVRIASAWFHFMRRRMMEKAGITVRGFSKAPEGGSVS